ncbi:hypothetical protein G5714_017146 [Onychostoma macrolepis]|uniref:Uncharacterized protein n=1 Tax=Onychostoma macrolepis TaxID=369639 RepID=A0A7J6C572_9TELE|nr:hypothetical protein G5714_017146 [Onychostoma macrolepis]
MKSLVELTPKSEVSFNAEYQEAGRCTLSSSESDSESGGPLLERSGADAVRKRNKALQVRFKDICEAQNEAAHRGARDRSVSCKVIHRRYMTMPARRSIPNVTKSTGVQTSPDLKKRYQTFPSSARREMSSNTLL